MVTLIETSKLFFEEDIHDFNKLTGMSRQEFLSHIVIIRKELSKGKSILIQCSDIIFDKFFKNIPKYIRLIPNKRFRYNGVQHNVIVARFNYKEEIISKVEVSSEIAAMKYCITKEEMLLLKKS